MTLREKIEKQTGHYSRDVEIASVMLGLGTIGVIVLLCFDPFAKGDQGNPVWKIMCVGTNAALNRLSSFVFSCLRVRSIRWPNQKKQAFDFSARLTQSIQP
jgi:hypothetical protein